MQSLQDGVSGTDRHRSREGVVDGQLPAVARRHEVPTHDREPATVAHDRFIDIGYHECRALVACLQAFARHRTAAEPSTHRTSSAHRDDAEDVTRSDALSGP